MFIKIKIQYVSSEDIFYEWANSRNWPQSMNDVEHANFKCKAVEVTNVIEKTIPRSQVIRIINGDKKTKYKT